MSRLPIPGQDQNTWGDILNDYLSQSLTADGKLKTGIVSPANLASSAVESANLAPNSVTAAKLATTAAPSTGQSLSYDGTNLSWMTPVAASTTAGGDLAGTYPNPTLKVTNNVRTIQRSLGVNVFSITDPKYGGAGLGSMTQDTAALNAAFQDMVASGGGVLYAPAGTYKISSWPTIVPLNNKLPYSIQGAGRSATVFMSYAPNLAASLMVHNPSFNPGSASEDSGVWNGFTIDGTNAGPGAVGFQWGDVSTVTFSDINIQNFTQGDGMYFNNQYGWTERVTMQSVVVLNCQNALRFAVQSGAYGSFDYWNVDGLFVSANASQSAVVSEASLGIGGTIQRQGSKFRMVANMASGTVNTGKLFWIKGDDSWYDVTWNVNAEANGGAAVKHVSIQMDNGSASFGGIGEFRAYYLAPAVLAGGAYQFAIAGMVTVAGITDNDGSQTTFTGNPIGRMIYNNPSGYQSSVSSGSSWQNTLNADVFVTIPVTFTGNGTAGWNVDVWNGLPAGQTVAAGPAGVTIPITFVHYAKRWARLDVTNGTIGTPIVRWV
ncbi:MAG: hypothetical protein ABIQ04_00620 [Candidatus Saccharimonadales bacterium]